MIQAKRPEWPRMKLKHDAVLDYQLDEIAPPAMPIDDFQW